MTNTSQSVISLAILKVNWDIVHRDYLENFVPILAECIRLLPDDVVSTPVIQSALKEKFGLRIPHNSINSILRRVQKRGYIRAENRAYKRDVNKLAQLNFNVVQQKVLRMHESVIQHLIRFCAERFEIKWTLDEAENAFQSYIEENQLSIIEYSKEFSPLIPSQEPRVKGAKYIVGVYIQYLQEGFLSDFEYVETIVKGNMLANAIFLADSGQSGRKFRKTEVFFDTSFLIFALGHAGEVRKDPCIELINMLYENGAALKCFRHTLEEIIGVLEACAYRLRRGQLRESYGPSIEYFLMTGQTASDIELLIINLEKDLESLRIQVVEKPPYVPEYLIDEKKLTEILETNIPYHNPQAPQRDVDSVSAIMRLRRGSDYYYVEECRAIFITTNNALVKLSRDFFYEDSAPTSVPPCMPDYLLTNLLWIKKPLDAPDLPRKRIIADYYAATQPEEHLWRKYLAEVEKLKQSGRVTSDDYFLLRYSLEAKSALMDFTLGGEETFSQGTIPEILSLVHSRIKKEDEDEIKRQVELRRAAEYSASAAQAEERERLTRIRIRAQKYAKGITFWLRNVLMFGLFVGTLSTFPWDFPALTSKPLFYFISFLQAGLLILSIMNLMYGTKLDTCVRKIEIGLSNAIEKGILSLSET